MIFGNAMLGIRDVALIEHPILVLADQEVRDVLLKGQLRRFLFSHMPSPGSGLLRICASSP